LPLNLKDDFPSNLIPDTNLLTDPLVPEKLTSKVKNPLSLLLISVLFTGQWEVLSLAGRSQEKGP
jgi:hypothetical protein